VEIVLLTSRILTHSTGNVGLFDFDVNYTIQIAPTYLTLFIKKNNKKKILRVAKFILNQVDIPFDSKLGMCMFFDQGDIQKKQVVIWSNWA
jgi:hypothetical protein